MATGDGHYVAVADVTWPAAWTATQKANAITLAEELIERVTRDVFYAKTVTLTLDGNGRQVLFHGQSQALLSVTSITFLDTDGTEEVYDGDYAFDAWSVTIHDDVFPSGRSSVVIAGTVGWAATPQAVKDAAKILCEATAVPSSHVRAEFASERIGDYSYTRAIYEGRAVGVPVLTGVLDADRLLQHYVRRQPGIGMA